MKLNLITFASVFQKQEAEAIRNAHKELFKALDEAFDVNIIFGSTLEDDTTSLSEGPTLLFIATGGTEGMVVKNYDKLPKPAVLLTDGKANSLAASLELACWMRQHNDNCRVLHGEMEHVVAAIKEIAKAYDGAAKKLEGQRIGVIGEPSDWLVSSGVDYSLAKQRWGVEYVDLNLSKVEEYFEEATCEVSEIDSFLNNAVKCIEPTREDIEKAIKMYKALKRMAVEEDLDALTVQCFALIPTTHTTGCLALALLNDEGIVAGCEGDMQSIFTMLLAKRATGVDGFMANPARIDCEKNRIILAHCTIGLQQTERYIIRSHFESQSGVAIQGILKEGPVTIVKCGGKDLSKSIVLTGRIVENQDDQLKCRTQLLIELDGESPVSYFLERNIGNHHIILQGNHRKALEAWL